MFTLLHVKHHCFLGAQVLHIGLSVVVVFVCVCFFLFFLVSKQGPCFTPIEEDGGDKRLAKLELACEAVVLHRQILLSLAVAAIAEAILMQTSVEQLPSSHRVAPK